MDLLVEAAIEFAGEPISEGIDAAMTSKKEKDKKKNQEDKKDGYQEFDH